MLTPISDFSGEQRETNMQLLHQVELGFPNGNGCLRYKSRLVKWLTLENEKKLLFLRIGGIRRKSDGKLSEDVGLE